jgi:hypothetical protein
MKQSLIVFMALLLVQPAVLAQEVSRAPVQERTAECQAAIAAELAPIRTQKIEECVANKEKVNKAECERFYRDYGERLNDRVVSFEHLPACKKVSPHRLEQPPAQAEKQPAEVEKKTGAEILTGREVIKQPKQRQVVERPAPKQVTNQPAPRPVVNQPAQKKVTSGTEGRNVTGNPEERNVTK